MSLETWDSWDHSWSWIFGLGNVQLPGKLGFWGSREGKKQKTLKRDHLKISNPISHALSRAFLSEIVPKCVIFPETLPPSANQMTGTYQDRTMMHRKLQQTTKIHFTCFFGRRFPISACTISQIASRSRS